MNQEEIVQILTKVLYVLLAIAAVVLAFYVTVWILGLLGLAVPDKILTIAFVVIGLMAAIGVFTGRWGG